MDRSEARQILRRFGDINEEIRKKEQAYKSKCDEIDIIASIPSPVQLMTGMPHTVGISKTTERTALRRIEIAESIREELERLNDAVIDAMRFRDKVEEILIMCSFDEESVIRQRYQRKMSQEQIARLLHVDRITVWRYEAKVLDTICELWV